MKTKKEIKEKIKFMDEKLGECIDPQNPSIAWDEGFVTALEWVLS